MMRVNQYNLINNSGYPALVKECGVNYPGTCNNPEEIADMMRALFSVDTKMEEEFWVICLNSAGKVTGVMSVAKGGFHYSMVDMKSVFTRVLLLGATGIVICHNHPSGECRPSSCDDELTKRIKQVSELLEIAMHDHVIVGGDNYFSFKEGGIL